MILQRFLFILSVIFFLPFIGFLRLGAMARDKGNFYVASDWFKDALQINQVAYHDSYLRAAMMSHMFDCLIYFLNFRITRTPGPWSGTFTWPNRNGDLVRRSLSVFWSSRPLRTTPTPCWRWATCGCRRCTSPPETEKRSGQTFAVNVSRASALDDNSFANHLRPFFPFFSLLGKETPGPSLGDIQTSPAKRPQKPLRRKRHRSVVTLRPKRLPAYQPPEC